MNIETVKFFPIPFVEIAVDRDSGTKLLGMPFDHGCAGHTVYHVISDVDFERALTVEGAISEIHGSAFFYSTLVTAKNNPCRERYSGAVAQVDADHGRNAFRAFNYW